ncbi:cysteine-rich RLK (receptor-like protein kinase) 8 [Trifolium medium]|uniref:Cysteine-rich RLK (Receptor-like protein kinase) 8 n=1 Tax=Trifolium medium TaxID=97028 RepID=A0A392MKT2_9FABA|nr:cysteine-rich RLK (receptor-like protein kinase) 8 [Trifolium medium]
MFLHLLLSLRLFLIVDHKALVPGSWSLYPPLEGLSGLSMAFYGEGAKSHLWSKWPMSESSSLLQSSDICLSFNLTFLHGDLEEEVCKEQPPGFVTQEESPTEVCQLHRSLYALKQSPGVWFGRFNTVIGYNFVKEKTESSNITTSFVNSNDQLADVFTRSLRGAQISYICNKLGAYDLYAPA